MFQELIRKGYTASEIAAMPQQVVAEALGRAVGYWDFVTIISEAGAVMRRSAQGLRWSTGY